MKPFRSHSATTAEIAQALALKPSLTSPNEPLQRAVDALHKGRRYLWTGLYLFLGEDVACAAFRGPAPGRHRLAFRAADERLGEEILLPEASSRDNTYKMRFVESKTELVMPVKIAGRVLGVLDIESDREFAFGPQERVLLKEFAGTLASYLAGPGKFIVRKAKDKVARRAEAAASSSSFRAAAGDKKQG